MHSLARPQRFETVGEQFLKLRLHEHDYMFLEYRLYHLKQLKPF